MKSLEAFTFGKRIGQPEANEDRLVIMPGTGYAVIDGVTDRNGTKYGGMLAGRFASYAAGLALTDFLTGLAAGKRGYDGPEALIAVLTEALANGYRSAGVYDRARTDWTVRAGCAATIAFFYEGQMNIVAVGDSGVRINGGRVIQGLKPLDDVTSRLRQVSWRYFEARGVTDNECEKLAASVTWKGTRNQPDSLPTASAEFRAAIEAQALQANREALPDVPEDELLELIHNGIANGQGKFQNATDLALGYGVIDGLPVPARYIDTASFKLSDVETIELFSDGYFSIAKLFGVAAWEAEFERVECEDPHKIGPYMSTKGTTATVLTDDRTYLGVRLR